MGRVDHTSPSAATHHIARAARFKELREQGFEIVNEMERTVDGVVLSRYWLRFDPERDGAR